MVENSLLRPKVCLYIFFAQDLVNVCVYIFAYSVRV